MRELIGKKIESIWIGADESLLLFKTNQGEYAYEGIGDCCSETWFADITGVNCLLGSYVIHVEGVETISDVEDDRTRQEYDEIYGYKLTANKGYVDIVFRNSSNGYYGGYCELSDYRADEMVQITDDWSA